MKITIHLRMAQRLFIKPSLRARYENITEIYQAFKNGKYLQRYLKVSAYEGLHYIVLVGTCNGKNSRNKNSWFSDDVGVKFYSEEENYRKKTGSVLDVTRTINLQSIFV